MADRPVEEERVERGARALWERWQRRTGPWGELNDREKAWWLNQAGHVLSASGLEEELREARACVDGLMEDVADSHTLIERLRAELREAREQADSLGAVISALGEHRDARPFVDDAVRALVARAERAGPEPEEARRELDELRSERAYLAKQVAWEPGQLDDLGRETTPTDTALEAIRGEYRRAEKAEAELARVREAANLTIGWLDTVRDFAAGIDAPELASQAISHRDRLRAAASSERTDG